VNSRAIGTLASSAAALLCLIGCEDLGSLDQPQPVAVDCSAPGTICTVIGTGDRGFNGENLGASQALLYFPLDLDFDPQGRLHVLDLNNFRIRRLDADGRLRTIMGDGTESSNVVEGAPARDQTLHHAYSMDFDAAGSLYIAVAHVFYVLRVDPAGLLWIVAGDGNEGHAGDGGPARSARLGGLQGVAVHPSGAPVWIADSTNNCIRRVDASGIITTIAGRPGAPGFAGDGGPAVEAQLWLPARVRYDAARDVVLIADTQNHAIRRIGADGIITTLAGTGQGGFSGDGGLATQARLNLPYDAVFGDDGALYIADAANNRIRRVSPDGIISTYAGTGSDATSGDGAAARDAGLGRPSALVFDAAGDLWVADTFGCRVRRIAR
jgi:sugar lactone lactonase YvrE